MACVVPAQLACVRFDPGPGACISVLPSAHPSETPACWARMSGRLNAYSSATAWSSASIRPRTQCRRQTAAVFADKIWSAVLTSAD